jgi:hypothetical protein
MIEYTVKIDIFGNKRWYNTQGERHRVGGPAVEYANGHKYWYLNDELHREDGPAVEYPDGSKEWYLNGKELTEEEFNNRLNTKELSVEQIQQLLGYKIKIVE